MQNWKVWNVKLNYEEISNQWIAETYFDNIVSVGLYASW